MYDTKNGMNYTRNTAALPSAGICFTRCLCGHCVHISRKKNRSTSIVFGDATVQSTHDNALYEAVVTRREHVDTLELKNNVAYGPVR